MQLPNGKVVDILTAVLDEISEWLQDNHDKPESGGYIIGYQHKDTGNIVLESVSVPQKLDKKTRIRFDIKDPSHNLFLKRAQRNKSYYMKYNEIILVKYTKKFKNAKYYLETSNL
jgi:hypothetical protein